MITLSTKTSAYGKLANTFCRAMATRLIRKNPKFFDRLKQSLRMSDIKLLANTYISMMLFTSILLFLLGFGVIAVLGVLFIANKIVAVAAAIGGAIALGVVSFISLRNISFFSNRWEKSCYQK